MPTLVGQKGQMVIEKRIREKLGVKPKSLAIQSLVGDHIEVRFVPPVNTKSLAGSLRKYIKHMPKASGQKLIELENNAVENAIKKDWESREKH